MKNILFIMIFMVMSGMTNSEEIILVEPPLEFIETPVKTAVEILFLKANIKTYSIDIQEDLKMLGNINLVVTEKTELSVLLNLVLVPKGLTYEIDKKGIYHIKKRSGGSANSGQATANFGGDIKQFSVKSGSGETKSENTKKIENNIFVIPPLEFMNTPLKIAIETIFIKVKNQAYSIEVPYINNCGMISYKMEKETELETLLNIILEPKGLTFEKDKAGIYHIIVMVKKLKILFVQGHGALGIEFKYFSRTFVVDKDLEIISITRTGPATYAVMGVKNRAEQQALSKGFPKDKEDIGRYDVIVFNNVPVDFFNAEQLDALKYFVKEHGGGFLAMGSSDTFKASWSTTPIAEMFPVILEKDDSVFKLSRGPTDDFKIRLTPDGILSEIFKLEDDSKKVKDKWESMPDFNNFAPVQKAREGSTVLMVHSSEKNDYGNRIILATQNYGAGRTAALTVDSTWRWALTTVSTDKSYEIFWKQLIRWLVATEHPKDMKK